MNKMLNKKSACLGKFTLMEGSLLFGEKDSDVVESAWDFSKINSNYEAYIQYVKKHVSGKSINYPDRAIAKEKLLWERALKQDPLLPKPLLPKGYLGQKANQLRKKLLRVMMKSLLAN